MVRAEELSNVLPVEFHQRHQYLLYCNDIIVNILHMADDFELSKVTLHFENDEMIPDDVEDVIRWMFDNGFQIEARNLLNAHLLFSLGGDMMMYLHESFSCSERGKVTVAFADSRKPIQDTFAYLCWLLVDSVGISDSLLNKTSRDYDLSSKVDLKKDLLEKAA
ncbi:MAG: hypothetical protein LBV19_06480 [Streptococcaceae bacterium]|jgi:hypothetical protein|nr:hypothetical protein [Streptococcaceae bacterium]